MAGTRGVRRDKRNLEDWGSERIERVLVERGVERPLIAAALAGVVRRRERGG